MSFSHSELSLSGDSFSSDSQKVEALLQQLAVERADKEATIEKLNESLSLYQNLQKDYEELIPKLKHSQTLQASQISNLQVMHDQITEARQEKMQIEQIMQLKQQQYEQLQKEFELQQMEYTRLNEEFQKTQFKIKQMNSTLNQKEKECKSLKLSLDQMHQTVETQAQQLNEQAQIVTLHIQENQALKKSLSEQAEEMQKCSDILNQFTQLSFEREQLLAVNQHLQQENQQLALEKNALEVQCIQSTQAITQTAQNAFDSANLKHSEQMAEMERKLHDSELELNSKAGTIRELQKEIELMVKTNMQMKRITEDAQKEKDQRQAEDIRLMQQKLDDSEAERRKLHRTIEQLERECREEKQRIGEIMKAMDGIVTKEESTSLMHQTANDLISSAMNEEKVRKAKDKNDLLKEKIKHLKTIREKEKQKMEKAQNDMKERCKEEIDRLNAKHQSEINLFKQEMQKEINKYIRKIRKIELQLAEDRRETEKRMFQQKLTLQKLKD
ncbi:uncharacterized protein MONOS_11007 [Monocercomonoides exilis]|uniref:uncharacterized protein n=1 Tax=Monocercomonoides exilis TaxID=2049356 RepID=UPI00355951B6|nr:hypothetical protein MONOS_11007 [Monocercomonoides exilis]|eukprot:MONOS_11007.1-p1 / transcript=MONOS_11007.1 / gene=MONOS_11007 / organism=Monocercomonoides_exilis_PA203 / gene_product=unspecified product / transcript_product=unspecified product / location=Mono_scaffold00528:2930-5454(-) / protein_length=500 / sequence_SO=supercontig / SO=protein_coding / is_pseudo=false